MPRLRTAPSILLFLTVTSGCSTGGDAAGSAVVADSAGVSIVTSPGAALERPLERQLASEPHLRIGVVEGADELQFTAPNTAVRLSDGRLLVGEAGARRARLFSPEGEFQQWIGGLGDGPEEYRNTAAMGLTEGDSIWIWDGGRRRVLLFTPSGAFVRGFTVAAPEEGLSLRRGTLLQDGRLVLETSRLGAGLSTFMEGDGFQDELGAFLTGRDGGGATSIARAVGQRFRLESPGQTSGGPAPILIVPQEPLFHPLPRFTTAPDRVFLLDPGPFEIRELSPEGELLRIFRVDHPRTPITADMRRLHHELRVERMGEEQARAMAQRSGPQAFADSLPHFHTQLVAADGALWVSEHLGMQEVGIPSRWWRFDEDGALEGYLDLPEGLRLLHVGPDEVLGVERDDFDVPYLVGYRLIRDPD